VDGSFEVNDMDVDVDVDVDVQEQYQYQLLASTMKGSKLRQVDGVKVVEIILSARTMLEVREWPRDLPYFVHFQDASSETVNYWDSFSKLLIRDRVYPSYHSLKEVNIQLSANA